MRFHRCICMAAACAALLLASCQKDNPVSFVDSYSVKLLEARGDTYTGDYYPLRVGYTSSYAGTMSVRSVARSTSSTVSTDTTMTLPATASTAILAPRPVSLPGGTVPLYPQVDVSAVAGQTTRDTSQFLAKDSVAVYVKALKLANGTFVEVKNPIFIKSVLIVGDSWETEPNMDMTKFFVTGLDSPSSSITLNERAKFFVAGREAVDLPAGPGTAMRLEQACDISMAGTITSQGTTISMSATGHLISVYHLIADTGIVDQNLTGPLDMTMSSEGQTMTVSMYFNYCLLKLTGITAGSGKEYSGIPKPRAGGPVMPGFRTNAERKMWLFSQRAADVVARRLGL